MHVLNMMEQVGGGSGRTPATIAGAVVGELPAEFREIRPGEKAGILLRRLAQ
jgi:outer membrane lipoprotein SlyB